MVDTRTIADAAETHPDRLRVLERRTIHAATQPLARAIASAQSEALARWTNLTTTLRATPAGDALQQLIDYVRRLLRDAFQGRGKQARRDAERAAYNAAHLGVAQASAIAAAMRGQATPPVAAEPGPAAQQVCEDIPAAITEEHHRALALLTTASLTALGLGALNSAFQRARRAIGRIATGMAVAITTAAANGVRLVAKALGDGVRLLWVAEPDACPACAAYAGRHIRPGGIFPGGLSLDPRRTVFVNPTPGPPRHPHCRCVLIPWSPSWLINGTPLPALLRQRARTVRRP
ncbi:hypothetical protein ACWD3J_13885 [Streptomyces sp. NPDC002755]